MSFGDRIGLAGFVLALISLAATILWPDKKWIGWFSLSCAVALLVVWGWVEFGASIPKLRDQYPILSIVGIFIIGGCISVSLWMLVRPRISTSKEQSPNQGTSSTPSLVFVFGVPVGDNDSASWMMLLRHYGPNTAYNCDIIFSDDDRKNIEHHWRAKHHASFSPPVAGESQKRLHVAEANSEGAIGGFQWNPLNPDSQHHTVSISCRDGVFEEKWDVTRVDGILRAAVTIVHGPLWMKKNPNSSPVVFRFEDPEFVRTALATEVPQSRTGRVVNPGWKPSHRFEVPAAIIDPNGNLQVMSGVTLPDGSTLTDFGAWNILTRHFGD
jgi:hypothetical protein